MMDISLEFFTDAEPFNYLVQSQKHEIGTTVAVETKLHADKTLEQY